MRLTDVLPLAAPSGHLIPPSFNPEIKGMTEDSRVVQAGYVFAAVQGVATDGRTYIKDAIRNGAAIIIATPGTPVDAHREVVVLFDPSPRRLLGQIAALFYHHQPEVIAAVTGTNGKTSVVNFCRQLWSLSGKSSASIGTIGVYKDDAAIAVEGQTLTTPDCVGMHKMLSDLAADGVVRVALEASSHGLDQARLSGVNISIGAFTNITRDHLDYHKTGEAYFAAKLKLFTENMVAGGTAILNADIPEFKVIHEACAAKGHTVITYGKKGDIALGDIVRNPHGQDVAISFAGKEYRLSLPLIGEFQVYNVLCAIGIVLASGEKAEQVIENARRLKPVAGRMQLAGQTSSGASIYVDYAHTPDALQKVLEEARKHVNKGSKLGVVFGCGGDRDKGKRPQMGKTAGILADFVVVTDDNPRFEDAAAIRCEVLAGCGDSAVEISDRAQAIRHAIAQLRGHDILVVAGKGHEKAQIIGKESIPFDDVDVVNKNIGRP